MLYLPRAMSFAEDPEANALAYLYRVAYTVTSRQLGVSWPQSILAVELTTHPRSSLCHPPSAWKLNSP